MSLKQLHQWHQTKTGLLVFALVELLAAWALVLRAIDTGSLWQYGLVLVLFFGGLHNLFRLIRKLFHGDKRPTGQAR